MVTPVLSALPLTLLDEDRDVPRVRITPPQIGFGLYPVAVEIFASGYKEKANPFIFTFYRAAFAAPLLFLISYLIEGPVPIPSLDIAMMFMMLSFFGMFLGQYCYIWGLYLVGPDISSALQPLIAVWTPIISICCCVEKVPSFLMIHTYAKIIGILMAVGGAAALIFSDDNLSHTEVSKGYQAIGCLSLILDTLCGGIYYTLQKKLIFKQPQFFWRDYPIALTAYFYSFGGMFMGLSVLYYVFTGQYTLFFIPEHSFPALLYSIFITSSFCYWLTTWSNKHLPSSIMAAFWPVQVMVTVVAAYLLIGDELTFGQYLGAFSIFIGLGLVLYSNHVDEQLE